MNKQILFWSGTLTAFTLWLGWGVAIGARPGRREVSQEIRRRFTKSSVPL